MTIHRIEAPDWQAGHELRAIVWNDETGEATGNHSYVPTLARALADPMPITNIGDSRPNFRLEDPAHNPADFLRLIHFFGNLGVPYPERIRLPESLRGVEQTPPLPDDTPPGAVN